MKKKDKAAELPQENSILLKPLTMAENFLEEVAEFIEKLVTGQQGMNEDSKDGADAGKSGSGQSQQSPRIIYKFDKDFSVELQYFLQESHFVVE